MEDRIEDELDDESLYEEDGKHPLDIACIAGSLVLMLSAIYATMAVTVSYVQANSDSGSWTAAIGMGLIACFGGCLLKWAITGPLAPYKQQVEMCLVPIAFCCFSGFVYSLTSTFFYIDLDLAASSSGEFVLNFDSEPAQEVAQPQRISLKWLYTCALGVEMCLSYISMSWLGTASLPRFKGRVRSILSDRRKEAAHTHAERAAARKAGRKVAPLDYTKSISSAPGLMLKNALRNLTKND